MLTQLLPERLRPYGKAVAAALATLAGVGVTFIVTGDLDREALSVALTGLVGTLLVFSTPNDV
jgi:hypothetical protein